MVSTSISYLKSPDLIVQLDPRLVEELAWHNDDDRDDYDDDDDDNNDDDDSDDDYDDDYDYNSNHQLQCLTYRIWFSWPCLAWVPCGEGCCIGRWSSTDRSNHDDDREGDDDDSDREIVFINMMWRIVVD